MSPTRSSEERADKSGAWVDRRTVLKAIGGVSVAGLGFLYLDQGAQLDQGSQLFAVSPRDSIRNLVRIDPKNLESETVVSLSVPYRSFNSSSVAFSPGGDLVGYNGSRSSLFSIDVETGDVSIIGSDPLLHSPGLAFDRDGNLYGLNTTTNELLSVDPETADVIVIGRLGIDVSASGLAVDFTTGDLFAVAGSIEPDGVSDELIRIDKGTGRAEVVGSTGVDFAGVGLEFDPVTANLISVRGNPRSRQGNILRMIDPETGKGETLGSVNGIDTNNLAARWPQDPLE